MDAIFDVYDLQVSPTSWEKPLVTTELRASSHISQLDNFQTLKKSHKFSLFSIHLRSNTIFLHQRLFGEVKL